MGIHWTVDTCVCVGLCVRSTAKSFSYSDSLRLKEEEERKEAGRLFIQFYYTHGEQTHAIAILDLNNYTYIPRHSCGEWKEEILE